MIKKVHFASTLDKKDWHPVWVKCFKSWQENSDLELILWSAKDIENLVEENFPEYYEDFISFPYDTMRLDLFKLFVLIKHGGVYSDLDVFCYKSFHDKVENNFYLGQGINIPNSDVTELTQTCLLISPPEHWFPKICVRQAFRRLDVFDKRLLDWQRYDKMTLFQTCSVRLISDMYFLYKDKPGLKMLTHDFHTQSPLNYEPSFYTKHMFTGLWGKREYKKIIEKYDSLEKGYKNHTSIDINTFDFYKRYEDI
jgi:hypothetical protein|tara:strand:- start:1027 stop:1785 length:759 start_codon:yes stop_codon:yes gene_type:complete